MNLTSPIGNEVNVSDINKSIIYYRHGWTPDDDGMFRLRASLAAKQMTRLGVSTSRALRSIAKMAETLKVEGER